MLIVRYQNARDLCDAVTGCAGGTACTSCSNPSRYLFRTIKRATPLLPSAYDRPTDQELRADGNWSEVGLSRVHHPSLHRGVIPDPHRKVVVDAATLPIGIEDWRGQQWYPWLPMNLRIVDDGDISAARCIRRTGSLEVFSLQGDRSSLDIESCPRRGTIRWK